MDLEGFVTRVSTFAIFWIACLPRACESSQLSGHTRREAEISCDIVLTRHDARFTARSGADLRLPWAEMAKLERLLDFAILRVPAGQGFGVGSVMPGSGLGLGLGARARGSGSSSNLRLAYWRGRSATTVRDRASNRRDATAPTSAPRPVP
jgi:hypothetical protein